MDDFLASVAHQVTTHPTAAGAVVAGFVVLTLIRAVITTSHRYR